MFLNAKIVALHSCTITKQSFEEARFEHRVEIMAGSNNSLKTASGFGFFSNREAPKLPTTTSAFNFPCFGQTSQGTNKNTFAVSSNLKQKTSTFDEKISSIQHSLSTISNQPRPSFDPATNKTMSERAQRIAVYEAVLNEVKELKVKVLSLESCIGKILMDELDNMKQDVTMVVGFQDEAKDHFTITPNGSSRLFTPGATPRPFSFGDSPATVVTTAPGLSFGPNNPKPVFEQGLFQAAATNVVTTSVAAATANGSKRELDGTNPPTDQQMPSQPENTTDEIGIVD